MQISFHGPRLKIQRAYKHINELETWQADLVKINADTARRYKEANPDAANHSVLVNHPSGYTNCVSAIVGDAVHCQLLPILNAFDTPVEGARLLLARNPHTRLRAGGPTGSVGRLQLLDNFVSAALALSGGAVNAANGQGCRRSKC
jgi:hypothetical protein